MRGIACVSASRLITKRRAGLSTAQRLRLEDHLNGCVPCRTESDELFALSALSDTSRSAISDRQRSRALDNALATIGDDAPARLAPANTTRRRWLVGGVAVACAAGIALSVVPRGEDATEQPAATNGSLSGATAGERLLSGDVTVAGIALSADGIEVAGIALSVTGTKLAGIALSAHKPLPATSEISSARGATVALAHAVIDVRSVSTIRWDRAKATVTLVAGSVRARVAPGPKQAFRVATKQFTADVIGTAFEVTSNSVRVDEGVVRILAPSGRVLVERLEAGHSWRIDPPKATAAVTIPTAPDVPPKATAASPRRRDLTPAVVLLARARGLLAQGEVAKARNLVAQARKRSAKRTVRAEADTLRAECELVAGNLGKATRLYLAVARRYAGSAAGQTALFAAARTETRRGAHTSARQLLSRYITTYPRGRFSAEAKRRLDVLNR